MKRIISIILIICSLKCIYSYAQMPHIPSDGMISELEQEKEQAVLAYQQFIDGRSYIGDVNIYELSMPTGEPDRRYPTRYAVIDSNGDDIPELHIQTAREFTVISFENGELTCFKQFLSEPTHYCLLKNGAYMYYSDRASRCFYSCFELDGEGNQINKLDFYWDENNGNYIPDEEDDFFYDGNICPMEEWYDRTRKYLYTDENGKEQIRNQLEWMTYCEADPFETNGQVQVLYKGIAGGYQLTLYDKEYNEILSESYPKSMWIDGVSEDVLEIGISNGNTDNYTYYFNKETAQISDTSFNSIVFGDKYIAYMEDDVYIADDAWGAGERTLILSDIFKKGILYQKITRDFSRTEEPMSAVISIEMIDSENIRLEYYKGEEFNIESEIIGITYEDVKEHTRPNGELSSDVTAYDNLIVEQRTNALPNQNIEEIENIYSEFLKGNIMAGSFTIDNLTIPTGEEDRRYPTKYAFADVTGDGIPELHVDSARYYYVFKYNNGELIRLLDLSPYPYYYALKNGGFISHRFGAGPKSDEYVFYLFNDMGNEIIAISFSKYDLNQDYVYDDNDEYFFDGIEVTKEVWDELTERYLYIDDMGIEQIRDEIEWTVLYD